MWNFETFKEVMSSKSEFYILLSCKGISNKVYKYILNVWNKLEMKPMKDYHHFRYGKTRITSYELKA